MKLSIQSVVRSIDETTARMAASFAGWVLWPGLIGLCAGVTVWGVGHLDQLGVVSSNKLPAAEREVVLRYVAAAVIAVAVLYVLVIVVDRLVRKRWHAARLVALLDRLLSFVLAGPIVLALETPKIESSHPAVTLLLAACAAAV
ncbi:MAG: hypothetical protein JRI23_29300, partial [Deltaproteobacteria bacterium]|nr:hypothetical protein [Deltaproteobacteria bacterium]MBW2536239.1 hypothetical protein [Deltaproteobacteria bacterium]